MISLCILVSLIHISLSACPIGAIQGNSPDDCYKYFSIPKDWVTAEEDCINHAGHLASIVSVFQNSFVQTQLQAIAYYTNEIWVGGNSLSNGVWSWSDGSNFAYINWARGQPAMNQNSCTGFNSTDGKWYALSCTDASMPYLCKVPSVNSPSCSTQSTPTGNPVQLSTRSSTGTCQNGYAYFSGTGMCYKFYSSTSYNFQDSENRCQNDGAHLASIHSDLENSYIANSTQSYLQQETNVFIGLYFNSTTNAWQWTDGTFVGYTHWGYQRPFTGDSCGLLVNSQWPNYCDPQNFCNWFGYWDSRATYSCSQASSKIVYAACKMAPS